MGEAIGFVGTGAISEAMVRGLLLAPAFADTIILSPRNADVAGRLAREFPNVIVAPDNQSVIDQAEITILAVRPQIAREVIEPLQFRRDQTVISVIAATERDQLLAWIGADVHLVQAIPLPFVATRQGTTAIFPPDTATKRLFDALGGAVECDSRKEYDLLAAASALMSTYFGVMREATTWLSDHGLPQEKAAAYLSPLFASLAETAFQAGPLANFDELSREFATRGGLNEQVLEDFCSHGGGRALHLALDRVFKRITGPDTPKAG